ncbi:decaprenyl-phosphate phosphoribosyltransferase [Bellilinea sp.]|uniref:decaprenyl-phosphate phosphoribosyltransferase n=1 Tax=Bellilinea sp. TaxID=2838785 RepID=UPI002ADD8A18|nr:decaprenyl-phosphate phosphoribosyltransferase [Bellilinea sp.]
MLSALIKSMRPRQWSKNVFVLAAVVFDKKLLNPEAVGKSLAGMVLFCLLSSSVYLINDILDAEADRNHPQKRNRPIASGKLPVPVAAAAAVGIILITIPVSFLLSTLFGWIALIYFLVNLAYSTRLKHIPLIDVLIIAAGFVLRVAAGVSLIEVERFSPWLYVVTTLLALYIGFGKRRAELTLLQNDANNHRRVLDGYNLALLDQLITIVSGTTIVAYSLYTFSAPNLPDNHSMMLTIPFVIYGIFRYLYLIQVEQAGGAPEDIVLTDKPLQAAILLWGFSVLFVFYLN